MATVMDVADTNKVTAQVETKSCFRQTAVLTSKNLKVQRRNVGATIAQLGVGPLFIILLLIMDLAVKENNRSNDWYIETRDPTRNEAYMFSRCSPTKGETCYSFFVYGDSEAEASLGGRIATLLDVPGRGVAYGFNFVNKTDYPDLKDYLFTHMNTSRIGLEFSWPRGGESYANGESMTVLPSAYTIHYNGTANCGDLGIFNCENMQQQLTVPLMTAVDSTLLRKYAVNYPGSSDTARIKAAFKDFPHPALEFALDVVQEFGASFFFMAVSFNFIVQVRNLVSEKQYKLRDAMKQIGMLDSAYWSSWLLSSVVTNTVSTLLLIIMGAIAQFPFFLINDFLAYFIHFWLTMFAFTCSAFFVSSLVGNEQTAINVGLGFFILFFLAGSIVVSIFYGSPLTNELSYDAYRILFMAIPGFAAPFGFFQGFAALVASSSSLGATGMRLAEINNNIVPPKLMEDGSLQEPFWSLGSTWLWMLANSFICLIFAVYFDNALPNSYGRSEGWFFCLKPSFWKGSKSEESKPQTEKEDRSKLKKHVTDDMSEMVTAEANRIIDQEWENGKAPAVQVLGMEIFFNSVSLCGGASKMVKAVQGITYGIEKDSLFVLLGHNGAGKTTTINALVGNLRPTGGDAYVFGHSCDTGMRTINKIMGVCPQHDILWEQLTGKEHLELFAALRGMPAESIPSHVQDRIKDVNLGKAQDVQSGAYSGGMKRRLSIAIALLGDPQIVYLDEPTTGMDPVTRRDVWDMIIRAKQGRVIVLTTHSMEEADVLGDRVAIMSHGKIQALGTSLSLKKAYGGGYKMNAIVTNPDKEPDVANFMTTSLPGSELVNNVDGAMFFKVPDTDDETLVAFFKTVEERREELGISDFSVGLTTLEEVFLELSKRDQFIMDDPEDPDAALKAAAASQIKKLQFSVPEGAQPGMTLQLPHPDGAPNQPLSYTVKDDDKVGSVVFIEYVEAPKQNMATLQFPIPEGASEGMELELKHPEGGDPIRYTVPAGAKAGEMKEVQYKTLASTKPVGDDSKEFKPTMCGYLNALTIKTVQFQKTRLVQCVCIMIMPVVLMLLLLLLNLFFAELKVTSMCGPDIKEANCAQDGYNLTCVKDLLEMSFASTPPALKYGEVQRGWGINRNCGSDVPAGTKSNARGSTEVCYEGLEKPKFDGIPMTAPASAIGLGSVEHTRSKEVVDWYDGFRYTMTSSTCSKAFAENFDYDIACEEDKTPQCREAVNALGLTRSWRAENPRDGSEGSSSGGGGGGFGGGLSRCLPANLDDDDSTRRRQRQRRLAEYKPTDAQIATFDALEDVRDACEAIWLINVSQRLAAAPSIQSSITSKKSGVLGNFTTSGVVDSGYTTIQSAVLNNMWKYLSLDEKDKHCRINNAPSAFTHGNLSDICNSSISIGRDGKTMEYKHNASNCGECFGDALSNMQTLLFMADLPADKATNIASLFFVLAEGLKLGLAPSSLGFFAVNIFNQKSWRKWSSSICLMNDINDYYLAGKITTGTMTIPNPNPGGPPFMVPTPTVTVPKSTMFGDGIKLWDEFWPGFYQGMMLGFDSTSYENGIAAWKGFCDMDTDIDAVRGLSFMGYDTQAKVNTALWDNWGGDNVETKYMQEVAPRNVVGYKHHYYNTQTMAFDFETFDTETGVFDYVAYFNNSGTDDTKTGNWLAISEMIITPIFDEMIGIDSKPTMQLATFPNKFKCERDKWLAGEAYDCPSLLSGFLSISIVDFILLQFLPIIMMLMIYPTVTAIVYEKQQKLRMIMKMQGLPMSVYYFVTYALHYLMFVIICILMTIVGNIAGIRFFTIHNFGILWLFFLVWGHLCLAFAFFLSAFLSRMRTAMAVTFLIILILWQCGSTLFQQFLTNPNTTEESYIPLMILPPWVMFRWVYWFGLASSFGESIGVDNWTLIGGGVLPKMIGVMFLHWFIYMGLYWYLENVMVVGHGTAKSCCFCLDMRYWKTNDYATGNKVHDAEDQIRLNTIPQKVLEEHEKWHKEMYANSKDHVWKRPHDVQREHERTLRFEDIDSGKDPKVRICSMHKVFPSTGGNPEKMAVKCVSFGVNKKECFGLLGHNGAGKTTLLNMLTGLYPATSGTAFVDHLRLDRDLSQIYAKMGVCPQHDILWDTLTGRHHVSFFGRLKGYTGDALKKHVQEVLQSVNLSVAGDRKSGGYSGGMKRRLSVANSLIGNPDVVYME